MQIGDVTIVVPTSYIPSHPSTKIIDETINNIRFHFPDNEIILQIDGIREEQRQYEDQYNEYKNKVLWKCLHEYKNILPIIFDKHSHQTTMMKETIGLVETSLILYVEGDLPLRTDRPIEWQKCFDLIGNDKANVIRFYLREEVPIEHEHMMCGEEDIFLKTVQWSQNPHLALTEYYRKFILPNVKEINYIEDEIYGKVQTDCEYLPNQIIPSGQIYEFNIRNWEAHKMFIYYPDKGKNMSRVIHLDGRKSTQKFTNDDNHWGWKTIEEAKKELMDSGFFEKDEK
jgi:hypothetical protein